jgi:hypothetical protein
MTDTERGVLGRDPRRLYCGAWGRRSCARWEAVWAVDEVAMGLEMCGRPFEELMVV